MPFGPHVEYRRRGPSPSPCRSGAVGHFLYSAFCSNAMSSVARAFGVYQFNSSAGRKSRGDCTQIAFQTVNYLLRMQFAVGRCAIEYNSQSMRHSNFVYFACFTQYVDHNRLLLIRTSFISSDCCRFNIRLLHVHVRIPWKSVTSDWPPTTHTHNVDSIFVVVVTVAVVDPPQRP